MFRLFPIVIIGLFLSVCALRSPPPIPMPIDNRSVKGWRIGISTIAARWPKRWRDAEARRERAGRWQHRAGGPLLGEFFVDGLDEFVEIEGFFEDATGAEEFGHVEEVLIPLRAGHGDDLRVEIFSRQL